MIPLPDTPDMTPPTVTTTPPDPEDRTVWVESGRTEQGTYFIGFRCGHASWAMGRMDAQLYALGVLALVQRAEHDSAVMRLFVNKLDMDLDTAGMFLARDVRKNRKPVTVHDACRLGFVGGVSHRGLKPFLTVLLDGEAVGQWNLDAAREHAMFVIETCEAVDLDTELRRVLTEDIELDPNRAEAVIHDLQNFRWKPGDPEDEVIPLSELAHKAASQAAGTDLPEEGTAGAVSPS